MDEKQAREILRDSVNDGDNNNLFWEEEAGFIQLQWYEDEEQITLNDIFTVEVLEAIVWWMRNMKV